MAGLNRTSARITQPRSQGASQAMLLGTGLQPTDLDKAQVGIASMWYEGNPCNMHLDRLAARVREGAVDRAVAVFVARLEVGPEMMDELPEGRRSGTARAIDGGHGNCSKEQFNDCPVFLRRPSVFA